MILPIRTDLRLRHTPWMNYTLIAANVLIFAYTGGGTSSGSPIGWEYMLFPSDPKWWQFFTYQFLHAGWLHLIGNMVFLYIFGNSLEDRFGPLGYLAFYLAGGVFAGIGHILTSSAPVLGASGAIAGVMGAYLAWFPWVRVRTVIVLGYIPLWPRIPAAPVLLLWFSLQFQFDGDTSVAWVAHVVGFGFGVIAGLVARSDGDFERSLQMQHRRVRAAHSNRKAEMAQAKEARAGLAE